MSDRLNELKRLRGLAAEQLAWLEREIVRESALHPPTEPSAPPPNFPPPPVVAPRIAGGSASSFDPDKIISRYQEKTAPVKDQVRRGCFLYFFAAFALLGLAIAAWYFTRQRS